MAHVSQARWKAAYLRYITSPEWALFRQRVFHARGRRCQRCGQTRGRIDVHHLHYKTFGHEALCDVEVLCRRCHDRTHGRYRQSLLARWFKKLFL